MNIEKTVSRYKLKTNEAGKLFDPVRQVFVAATPEEHVRQRVIKYLINRMKVPPGRIVVEQSLARLGARDADYRKKRIDIGIMDENGALAAIIECKAHSVKNAESPFIQAVDYVRNLNMPAYFVTDGVVLKGYSYRRETDQYIELNTIPDYAALCTATGSDGTKLPQ